MLKKTITYVDYNGVERTEDHYFNMTQTELKKLNIKTPGGYGAYIDKALKEQNGPAILDIFDTFILGAYGKKDADGIRFMKSKEISEAFSQTEAYNVLFEELSENPDKAVEFIKAILPEEYRKQLK